MGTFLKENWYKLMVGTSMFIFSVGFFINSVSPAYSNSELEKSEMNNEVELNAPVGTNGIILDDNAYFVDGGYVYKWTCRWSWNSSGNWSKYKLP